MDDWKLDFSLILNALTAQLDYLESKAIKAGQRSKSKEMDYRNWQKVNNIKTCHCCS